MTSHCESGNKNKFTFEEMASSWLAIQLNNIKLMNNSSLVYGCKAITACSNRVDECEQDLNTVQQLIGKVLEKLKAFLIIAFQF